MIEDEFAYCSGLKVEDNSRIIDAWVLEYLSGPNTFMSPSMVKGKKAHLILRQDGQMNAPPSPRKRYGLWDGSMQHFSSLHLKINGENVSCLKYIRRPWYIYRQYSGFSRIDFVPPDRNFACIALDSDRKQELVFSFEISHLLMWPSGRKAAHFKTQNHENNIFEISSDIGQTFISVIGSEASFTFRDGILTARIDLKGRAFLSIGSEVSANAEELFRQAEEYYRRVHENCVLKSSLFRLDKTFLWSKIAILESYSETDAGNGFFAGFPEFSWFFGRDGLWTSYAAYLIGLHDMADSHIEMLWNNASEGRIPHEVPLISDDDKDQSYEVSGVKGIRTKYMSIDSTPLWIIAQGYRRLWSGKLIDKNQLNSAISFLHGLERNNDGLIENRFSEGLIGWPESWAKKRDGACIDVNAWFIEALTASHFLIDTDVKDIARTRRSFDNNFLNPDDPYFFDSIHRSRRRTIISPMGSVAGMYISGSSVQKMLQRLSRQDILTEAGMRSMSSLDSMYDGGYHTGQIWPLMTGWHSIACYNNDLREIGFRCITSFMDLAFSAEDPGRINETYDPEFFEPRGQFAQVWSNSLFVQSILEGLVNLVPQWRTGKSPIDSAENRLPGSIDFLEIRNILFQGSLYDIKIKGTDPPVIRKRSTG
ncbi:MAG: amylo-alpha-1,6-glucosidase [Thermoplasmata archaeon]